MLKLHDNLRMFLHEATLRLMAGASPNRTQQLLELSSSKQSVRPGLSLVCRGGRGGGQRDYSGQREHALALMMACRHLPPQLLSSPAERAGGHLTSSVLTVLTTVLLGMLTEAASLLSRLGDKKRMEECNKLMSKLASNCSS